MVKPNPEIAVTGVSFLPKLALAGLFLGAGLSLMLMARRMERLPITGRH